MTKWGTCGRKGMGYRGESTGENSSMGESLESRIQDSDINYFLLCLCCSVNSPSNSISSDLLGIGKKNPHEMFHGYAHGCFMGRKESYNIDILIHPDLTVFFSTKL